MKNHHFNLSRFILAGATLAFTSLAGSLQGAVISVNLLETSTTDIQAINTDETFGLGTVDGVNTTVGNWTNTSASETSLVWDSGPASTVNIGQVWKPNATATFNAAYDDTPLKAGFDSYIGNGDVGLRFDNLNANFPDGYFAIVYLTGFNTNTGASITTGTTTFFYQTLNSPAAPVSLTQTTQTTNLGDGLNPFAQYAIFGSSASPLTSDSIKFNLTTLYGGGSGIGGVQIVAVPESAAALLGSLGLLGLLRRRRN